MSEPVRRELKIPNETRFLSELRGAVREIVAEAKFPEGELNRLMLAVDESVTNVMEHAYENDLEGEMTIEVSLQASESEFIARVRDRGLAFDPTLLPDPDLTEHVTQGRRHGLGIYLIRKIMDEVSYASEPDGWNELTMVKRAGAEGEKKAERSPKASASRPQEG